MDIETGHGVGQVRRSGSSGGDDNDQNGAGRRIRGTLSSRNNKKKEDGVRGATSVISPQQSIKNRSSRKGKGFFPTSTILTSAKMNRSEKREEARRRDDSAGRIISEGPYCLNNTLSTPSNPLSTTVLVLPYSKQTIYLLTYLLSLTYVVSAIDTATAIACTTTGHDHFDESIYRLPNEVTLP